MLNETLLYGLGGIGLFSLGLRWAFAAVPLLRRVLAINIAGAGVFLLLIALAYRDLPDRPDPIPHALVLTGIVVAFSATALALALGRRLRERTAHE
jgi:multicomponent Na+:H+ antiporter subunit C